MQLSCESHYFLRRYPLHNWRPPSQARHTPVLQTDLNISLINPKDSELKQP